MCVHECIRGRGLGASVCQTRKQRRRALPAVGGCGHSARHRRRPPATLLTYNAFRSLIETEKFSIFPWAAGISVTVTDLSPASGVFGEPAPCKRA